MKTIVLSVLCLNLRNTSYEGTILFKLAYEAKQASVVDANSNQLNMAQLGTILTSPFNMAMDCTGQVCHFHSK